MRRSRPPPLHLARTQASRSESRTRCMGSHTSSTHARPAFSFTTTNSGSASAASGIFLPKRACAGSQTTQCPTCGT
eukprot:1287831-Lingulodinium_polyedra.AAC.1